MVRPKSPGLTARESEIMAILWELGSGSADEIRARLSKELHDSTVRSVLRTMEKKKLVKHKVDGRIFIYRPIVRQTMARKKAVSGLVKQLFDGSVRTLVLQLLEDDKITAEELKESADSTRPSTSHKKRG